MDTKKLYNDVYAKTKMGEAAFRRAFNGAARYIAVRYGTKYTTENEATLYIARAGEQSSLFEEYAPAAQNYIESTEDGPEARFGTFTALADLAYRTVWKKKNAAKRIRGCEF